MDVVEATVSDWKLGYCSLNFFATYESCCPRISPARTLQPNYEMGCEAWHTWTYSFWPSFAVYGGLALIFGIISASATILIKLKPQPAATNCRQEFLDPKNVGTDNDSQKTIYPVAGSGIPELKTITSGFEIPHFLDFKVLAIKGFGAVFAVATSMCLGKEGPFVHISACVAYLVGKCFSKYNANGRKMRDLLSVGCASGLCVAFGAPIGGVIFSYEVRAFFPCYPCYTLRFKGNQYVYPTESALAGLHLLCIRCSCTESAQSIWNR